MKLTVPEYFHRFKCIAGDCRYSCCVGWEIDIDEKTLEKFNTLPGIEGEELRASINYDGDTPCFYTSGNRCVHLRDDGLCELICRHGEEILSDICREHPRYYTTLGEVTYGGVGMTCEAACELILTERDGHKYTTTDTDDAEYGECDEELSDDAMRLHSELVSILAERGGPLADRLFEVITRTAALAGRIDERDYSTLIGRAGKRSDDLPREASDATVDRISPCSDGCLSVIFDLLSSLEYMGDDLPTLYESIKSVSDGGCVANFKEYEPYLTNAALYFLDRYMPVAAADGDLLGTLALTLISVFILSHAFSRTDGTLTELVDAAKTWSSEVEYCEENVDEIRASAEDILPTLIFLILNAK